MVRFISVFLEVQIVKKLMVSSFVDTRNGDAHVELSPSFLLDLEWWLLNDYLDVWVSVFPAKAVHPRHALNLASAKGRMEFVGGLLEDGRRNLLPGVFVEEGNTDGPFAHGKSFYTGLFPAAIGQRPLVSEHCGVVRASVQLWYALHYMLLGDYAHCALDLGGEFSLSAGMDAYVVGLRSISQKMRYLTSGMLAVYKPIERPSVESAGI